VHASAGKTKNKTRGGGDPWLAGTLGNIAAGAARTDTFLGARYRRLARRRGGLGAFQGQYGTDIVLLCAGSLLIILPVAGHLPDLPAQPRRGTAAGSSEVTITVIGASTWCCKVHLGAAIGRRPGG
jgi:hypothetical protein